MTLFTSDITNNSNNADQAQCYACTRVGVPVFHSARLGASAGPRGRTVDPRGRGVKRLNRAVVVARGLALAVDPLFFYAVSLRAGGEPCFYADVALAGAASAARACLDAVHLGYLCLQFRLAYVDSESLVVGCGSLVWNARDIASHYLRSFNGFWLDAFVILPIPQVVIWFVIPKLLREEKITVIMSTILLSFLFQFVPKVYHIIHLMRRLQEVTGYIFGSVWWRFNLNIFAYLIASHVTGACWYILATERLTGCLQQQCDRSRKCNDLSVYCSRVDYINSNNDNNYSINHLSSGKNMTTISSKCLDVHGPYKYGIYKPVLLVYASNSLAVKILYPIFWGLFNLSSFGNELEPTCNWMELIFSCCITILGMALFVTLIGNIQVFLHMVMGKKKKMQLQNRDLEWWMNRRQLPLPLRARVRHFQRESLAAMGGQDEMELIQHFPDGLRRDIKRYRCLDLVNKVPLFHVLDDLILDNICDRVRPLVYSKGEKIIREGDPIQRMVFIIRGRVSRMQGLSKGFQATSSVEPGGFFGDELLSWCLRRPFVERLPASSATFACADAAAAEVFAIEADHLRYVVDHFRYNFASARLRRTARYHSPNWRSWGAAVIQLAWRRCRRGADGGGEAGNNGRLSLYAGLFLSGLRLHDHLE